MPFRFRHKESVAEGFHRVVREQTAATVSLLADSGSDITDRVHLARRSLKRLEALLRLVRAKVDPAVRDVEKATLRDAGRRLGRARDAEVAVTTFELLAESLPAATATAIRRFLKADEREARRRTLSARQLAAFATRVRTSGRAIAQIRVDAEDWKLIRPGLNESYREARKLSRKPPRTPAEAHHWRRCVKTLNYHLELLRRALPKALRKLGTKLDWLGEVLGHYHDLHALHLSLHRKPHPLSPAHVRALDELITNAMDARLEKASCAAPRLFRRGSHDFLRVVHRAWRKWRGG